MPDDMIEDVLYLSDEHLHTLNRAIKAWGEGAQLRMVAEECSELIKEILKYFRNGDNLDKIQEELADVIITAAQAVRIVGTEEVQKQIDYKMKRLEDKLNAEGCE